MSVWDELLRDEVKKPRVRAPSVQVPKQIKHEVKASDLRATKSPRETVEILRTNLDLNIFEQDMMKDVLLAALAGNLNALIVSPPGQGKTFAARVIARSVRDWTPFILTITDDLDRSDIFGDVKAIQKRIDESTWEVRSTFDYNSGIGGAHFVVVDEILKARGFVLRMFYSVMDSRTLRVGLEEIPCNALAFIGLTNPKDVELAASSNDASMRPTLDRFSVRLFLPRLSLEEQDIISDQIRQVKKRPSSIVIKDQVSLDDIRKLQEETFNVRYDEFDRLESVYNLVARAVRDKYGEEVLPSQRGREELITFLAALRVIGVTSLAALTKYLVHSMATSFEDALKIMAEISPELGLDSYDRIDNLLRSADKEIASSNFGNAKELLKQAEEAAYKLPNEDDRRYYLGIIERKRRMIDAGK